MLHADEVVLAFCSCTLPAVDPASGIQIGAAGGRGHHIHGDFVLEAQIFVDIGGSGLAGCDGTDDGCGAGDAVAAGEDTVQSGLGVGTCNQVAPLGLDAGLFEGLVFDGLADGHDDHISGDPDGICGSGVGTGTSGLVDLADDLGLSPQSGALAFFVHFDLQRSVQAQHFCAFRDGAFYFFSLCGHVLLTAAIDTSHEFSAQTDGAAGAVHGNVAMDCTRSAVRLGAEFVTCVYRRRQEDMTAQAEEVEGAIAEGAEVLCLHAPLKIEVDEEGKCAALWAQPQIIGEVDKAGRPRPNTASADPVRIPADVVIVAIGQAIEYKPFEEAGIKTKWGNLVAGTNTKTALDGVFSGGDCVTGPATVIRAIAAGKAAAANIDEYLGFKHEITVDVVPSTPRCTDLNPRGRINCRERAAAERKNDFVCMEHCMTCEEATKESSRCLRCDHFGYGIFKGGRVHKW